MVSPKTPETPNVQPQTEVLTLPQQQFELTVDQAYSQFLDAQRAYQTLEPKTLLSYMAGSLDSKSREQFQSEITRTGGINTVVATVKAARPVAPGAGFEQALASRLIRGLMNLVKVNSKPGVNELRNNVQQSAFLAAIDTFDQDDLDPIRDDIKNDNFDDLVNKADRFDGELKAYILGAAGATDQAQEMLNSLPKSNLNSNFNSDTAQTDSLLSRLQNRIHNNSTTPTQIMQSVLAFAHQMAN